MKIRQGFVSNSSTSSFVCSACGCVEAGRDIGLAECEMFHCKNGHYIHESCAGMPNLEPTEEYMNKYVAEYGDDKELEGYPEEHKEEMRQAYIEELKEEAKDEYLYEVSPELCPVCNFEVLSSKDELRYYRYKLSTTKKQTCEEIRKEFADYKEFKSKIYQ